MTASFRIEGNKLLSRRLSPRYIIDSYAWIEYFKGSEEGKVARKFIESTASLLPTMVIAEVYNKLLREVEAGRETKEGAEKKLSFMISESSIVDLNLQIAKNAAVINQKMRKIKRHWGLADSIVYATVA